MTEDLYVIYATRGVATPSPSRRRLHPTLPASHLHNKHTNNSRLQEIKAHRVLQKDEPWVSSKWLSPLIKNRTTHTVSLWSVCIYTFCFFCFCTHALTKQWHAAKGATRSSCVFLISYSKKTQQNRSPLAVLSFVCIAREDI